LDARPHPSPSGADLDAPKTFQDKVDEREKLRLIRRFFYGVCFYLVSTLLVIFLPLFLPAVVDRTLLALQNAVLWVFLAVLLWAFRMRQGSPYLMFDEAAAAAETGGRC
jgi:cobalamin biosynthesis protein CobD/CbiB